MKRIKLKGTSKYAIIDSEDYKYLSRFRWIYNGGVFATLLRDRIRYVLIPMSWFLMKAPRGGSYQICHKNKNDLDFRKNNLIVLFIGRKTHLARKRKFATSKYKGVSISRERKCWIAQISKDKKQYWIGCFKTEIEAGIAYNKKAKELYGGFAYRNDL